MLNFLRRSSQASDVEVEVALHTAVINSSSANSAPGRRSTVRRQDVDSGGTLGQSGDGSVVQSRSTVVGCQHVSVDGDLDLPAGGRGRQYDSVVDRVDGGAGVLGSAGAGVLQHAAVPDGTDGVVSGRSHVRGRTAVLVGADEGGDERLPSLVSPLVVVGVLGDVGVAAQALDPDVANVVAFTGVVLE